MNKEYLSPQAEVIEFDEKDVITTSGQLGDEESANDSTGWSLFH